MLSSVLHKNPVNYTTYEDAVSIIEPSDYTFFTLLTVIIIKLPDTIDCRIFCRSGVAIMMMNKSIVGNLWCSNLGLQIWRFTSMVWPVHQQK